MPTAREWMGFFYPYLFDGSDIRYALPSDVDMALAVALPWKPACLTVDQQEQAQAHYAAYVLEFRAKAVASGMSLSVATATVAGPIIEKQEGDVRVRYSESGGTSTAQLKEQLQGPGTPYAAWQALWEICVPPVAEDAPPPRKGAIITAFG